MEGVNLMKRTLPLFLAFFFGVIGIIVQMVPALKGLMDTMLDWMAIIAAFALAVGISSLTRHHMTKIRRKHKDIFFSYVTFVAMFFMTIIGLVGYFRPEGALQGLFENMYNYVRVPLDASMFALLAFYITSAAYRAFRARTWLATVLLLAGVIVMIGRVAFGPFIIFNDITAWIMKVPTTAAMRAVNVGIGLGIVATSIKIVLGIERSYLGGGE